MGTGSFPGVKRPGRGADHPPLLAPRSRKCRAIPLPPYGPSGMLGVPLPLILQQKRQHSASNSGRFIRRKYANPPPSPPAGIWLRSRAGMNAPRSENLLLVHGIKPRILSVPARALATSPNTRTLPRLPCNLSSRQVSLTDCMRQTVRTLAHNTRANVRIHTFTCRQQHLHARHYNE
jgi:hypothetical protein